MYELLKKLQEHQNNLESAISALRTSVLENLIRECEKNGDARRYISSCHEENLFMLLEAINLTANKSVLNIIKRLESFYSEIIFNWSNSFLVSALEVGELDSISIYECYYDLNFALYKDIEGINRFCQTYLENGQEKMFSFYEYHALAKGFNEYQRTREKYLKMKSGDESAFEEVDYLTMFVLGLSKENVIENARNISIEEENYTPYDIEVILANQELLSSNKFSVFFISVPESPISKIRIAEESQSEIWRYLTNKNMISNITLNQFIYFINNKTWPKYTPEIYWLGKKADAYRFMQFAGFDLKEMNLNFKFSDGKELISQNKPKESDTSSLSGVLNKQIML